MSLNDVISQYEEELMVFDIVKNDVDVLIDVGCRENYDYAQIKPEAKMYLFDVNEIFIKNFTIYINLARTFFNPNFCY